MRMIGLGTEFTRKLLLEIYNMQLEEDFDKTAYHEAIQEIYAKYSTNQLVKMATAYYKIK